MEKQPNFIREFTKGTASEERAKLADAIKALRVRESIEKAERVSLQRQSNEREQAIQEQQRALEILSVKMESLTDNGVQRLMNYFQVRKLRADMASGRHTLEELKALQEQTAARQKELEATDDRPEATPALQEAHDLLNSFYSAQKRKWAESPYSKEDVVKYFSEEHLASLSLNDYALLLQRFPKEMVTHVTRQGIRDHIGHIFHTANQQTYADGFMRIAADGRLRSPLGVYLNEQQKDKAIADFLNLATIPTREEALALLQSEDGQESLLRETYRDSSAVHFAAEEVANEYYGSETGNEIFFAYPSAYIASRYYFSGKLHERGGGYYNDQWVYANEERGLDINAGIVFIPEDVRVSRTTGSRYELDADMHPAKREDLINAIEQCSHSDIFMGMATEARDALGDLPHGSTPPESILSPFRRRLESEFGISDFRCQTAILDYQTLDRLLNITDPNNKSLDPIRPVAEQALQSNGILFAEAIDTVSSKEFWESYFDAHQSSKPKKIVYYRASSPTEALDEWRAVYGIGKVAGTPDIGFPENRIMDAATKETAIGSQTARFESLAREVITKFYDEKEAAAHSDAPATRT